MIITSRPLDGIVETLKKSQQIYIDVENNSEGELLCYTIGTDDLQVFVQGEDLVTPLIDKTFVGHNIAHDRKILKKNLGVEINNVEDTMIMSQIAYNGYDYTHKLSDVVERELGIRLTKDLQTSWLTKSLSDTISEEEIEYAMNDIKYLPLIRKSLMLRLESEDLEDAFNFEMMVLPCISEIRAPNIDRSKWRDLIHDWEKRVTDLEDELHRLIASYCISGWSYIDGYVNIPDKKKLKRFNLNSATQIKLLYHELGITPPIKDGKETVKKDILMQHALTNPSILDPFISLYVQYKETQKLITSFGDNMLKEDTLASNYGQCFTDTARINSWDFNLQNIPSRSEAGSKIRSCFIAPPGYKFVTCDMSSAELRIGAALSKDPLLIASFTEGLDLHSELATVSYRIINGDDTLVVTKDNPFRTLHKQVIFGIMYGAAATRVAQVLNISIELANECLKALLKKVPTLAKWLEGIRSRAKTDGVVIGNSITNRKRFRAKATEACNFPIQTTNADAMKLALVLITDFIRSNNIDGWICNTVHDEVCVIVSNQDIERFPTFVEDLMKDALSHFLCGIVDGGAVQHVGEYWEK